MWNDRALLRVSAGHSLRVDRTFDGPAQQPYAASRGLCFLGEERPQERGQLQAAIPGAGVSAGQGFRIVWGDAAWASAVGLVLVYLHDALQGRAVDERGPMTALAESAPAASVTEFPTVTPKSSSSRMAPRAWVECRSSISAMTRRAEATPTALASRCSAKRMSRTSASPPRAAGVPIWGTSPDAIDRAEDRKRFQEIVRRLDAVEELKEDGLLREGLAGLLKGGADMERLMSRISLGLAGPKELVVLRSTLQKLPDLQMLLAGRMSPYLLDLSGRLEPLPDMADWKRQISSEPRPQTLVVDSSRLNHWDSVFLTFLNKLKTVIPLLKKYTNKIGLNSWNQTLPC